MVDTGLLGRGGQSNPERRYQTIPGQFHEKLYENEKRVALECAGREQVPCCLLKYGNEYKL